MRMRWGLLALVAVPVLVRAEPLPPPADFLYCASFYTWMAQTMKGQDKSPELVKRLEQLATVYQSDAGILSDGAVRPREAEGAETEFRAALDKSIAEGKKMGEFYGPIDADCAARHKRYWPVINAHAEALDKAMATLYSHTIALGKVDAATIATRHAELSARAEAQVQDAADTVTYSFTRTLGPATEVAFHVFTKEGHPAHPAVVYLQRDRDAKGKTSFSYTGSYAGDKAAYERWSAALAKAPAAK